MASESMRYDIVLGFKADVEAAKRQLYDLQQNIEKITSKDFSVNLNTKELKAGYDDTSKQLITFNKLLNKSFNTDTGKVNLNKLIADTKAFGININELTDNLYGMADEYPGAKEAFEGLTKLLADGDTKAISFNKSIQRMGEQLIRTAKIQLSYAVLDQFTSVFRDSYNYAQELNESLNNIRIVTNKSKTDMSKFAVEANKAAKALSTTTTAYTDAALIYYQQGLNDDAVKERTDATVKLANVTGQSASEVSSYMTAIWNNYDDGSKSLEYYADAITALGAATASSSEEIATGLSQFSAVANTVGLSYEYASSALATVVAQTRLSADTVGTSFKTIFARLQSLNLGETLDDDTTLTKYTKAMDKVGVSIKNQDGTLKSMDSILDSLGTKWSKLSQEQKNGLAYTVAGARQYTNFIALMDNWQQMQANVGIAQASEGTLTRQQRIYEESWKAANDRLKASFESIYDTIINDDAFIFLTDSFSKLLDLVNKVVKGFGGFEGTLGILVSTATKLFRVPLNGWLSGVINTINQAYAIANKEAEKVQNKSKKSEQDATEIKTRGLEGKYNRRLNELTEQKNIALARSNPLDREQINEEYSKLIKQLKSDYIEQDKINQFNKTSAKFTKNYGQFITAVNYQQKLKNAKSFSEDDLDNFKEAVGFEYFSKQKQEEINNIKTDIRQARAVSKEYDSYEIANSLLADANKMKEDLTAQLEYGSVKRYPEQESAIKNQLAGIENIIGILSSYGEQESKQDTVENPESSTINDTKTIDNTKNNYNNKIIDQLSSIIDLLNKIKQINSGDSSDDNKQKTDESPESNKKEITTDSTTADNKQEIVINEIVNEDGIKTIADAITDNNTAKVTVNDTGKNNKEEKPKQPKVKETEKDNKTEPEVKDKPDKANKLDKQKQKDFIASQKTQVINQLNSSLTRLKEEDIKKILGKDKFNNLSGISLDKNKKLVLPKEAFTSVGTLTQEYQKLADEINKAAQKADVLENTDYTPDESALNKYDQMANSITKAVDLTSTMISLNATLSNTFNDLRNGDFSNLIGDISALAISFGNTYNTVAKLKDSLGKEEWNAITGPFKAIFKDLGNTFKKTGQEGQAIGPNVVAGTTEAAAGEAGLEVSTKSLATSFKTLWSSVLGPIVVIQAALFLLKFIITEIQKYIDNQNPQKRLQHLQDNTEDLKNAANEAAQAYENINNNINNLDTAADKIKNLTKGTLEWSNAVAKNNREIVELLSSYDMLNDKYLDTSGDYYTLTDLGKQTLQNRAYQEFKWESALYTASLIETKDLDYQIAEDKTQEDNFEEFTKIIELTPNIIDKTWQEIKDNLVDSEEIISKTLADDFSGIKSNSVVPSDKMATTKTLADDFSGIKSNPGISSDNTSKPTYTLADDFGGIHNNSKNSSNDSSELIYTSPYDTAYNAVVKAIEKDSDKQFLNSQELIDALKQNGLDENGARELAEQLFPSGDKSALLKSLEEEQLSRDKNTESLDLLTATLSRDLLEVDFTALGISSEVFNDPDFQKEFDKIYAQAAEKASKLDLTQNTAKNIDIVSKAWGANDASYDYKNERWEVNGQNHSIEGTKQAYTLYQIEKGDFKDEVIGLARQIQLDKGYKSPANLLNSSTDGSVQKDIETWKLDKNAIEDATEALYELYKAQGMTEDEAKRIVVAKEKLNAAYSDLIDKFKDYNIALKDNEKYSIEYQTALRSLRKDVAALFDINEDLISEDFLTDPETLKLLEQFQYGNLAASDELQKRLSYNLELDISEESKAKVTDALDIFYADTANNPLELGMTLDTEGPLQQLYDFFTKMLESGEMTAEQVNAALSSIGVESEVKWIEVEAGSEKLLNYSGELKVISADGKNEDTISHYDNSMVFDEKSKILMPEINGKSPYRGKPSHTISNTNKQKAAKKAASNKPKTKKVDDEKKRYYEINQQLEKLNDELNKITKAKERAFGKEKLGYLDQEINKYKDLEKAQQKYLDEVNSYLSSDMSKLAAYGAQFNDDGTLANYDELISKQVAQYNATANAENSNADEVYSNFTKALSNYEESLSKSREVLNQLIDYQNQIYDLKLEKIVYKVEYKVEINDKDLERLEWLLSNISDKAFKSAESIALMSKQMADYQSSFETVNKGIDEWFTNHTEISAEMKDAFLNGTLSADELASKLNTLTEAEKEQLYNWSSQLMQLVDNMEQVEQAIQDQLLKSFDDFTEKIDEQTNRLSTLNQIMSSYIEIAKLVGKENLGVSNELMKQMRQSTIDLSTQQINIMRKEYEAAKEELDKLMATPGVEPETIAQAKQRVSEIYANLLSQTQETVSAIQQMFADTMQDIADDFSKRMGGLYGSISELQLAYDRQKDLNEGYLETYQKSYELAKLTREINNSINDTDSLKGKQLLLSLEDEITQRQADRTKMSEYELNFLQKKYELYQAQIALEEAQNAKSQVRMTRDANGNMSYTYTADQEAIDKAEQGYNDALYNLMNLNQEQLQANQEKILSIVSEYYQNLIDLGYDQEEAAALANEHYQTLMAQAREEMDLTLGHASWIVEEMGVEEDLLIDKFDETVLAHITGTTTMEEYIDNWEAAVAEAISNTNTNYQEFQSNLASCLETAELDSGAFAEAVDADMSEVNDALIETESETDKLVDTFKSDFDKALTYVKDFDSQYAKFLENMRKNTNTLVQALNNLIKGFAELDGRAANVISTSNDRIAAAEVELESRSDETGGGGPNGSDNKHKYYFGNKFIGNNESEATATAKALAEGTPGWSKYISMDKKTGTVYLTTEMNGNKYLGRTDPYNDPNARLHNVKQFNTGGYTGDWSSNEGRLAILDKKELVLNADDTSNILEVVNIVRNLADTISNLTYRDKMESLLNNIRNIYDHIYDNIKIENSQNMDQYITIQADFPSVSSQVEIEAAFDNILLHASQYANRKA